MVHLFSITFYTCRNFIITLYEIIINKLKTKMIRLLISSYKKINTDKNLKYDLSF